MATVSLKPSAKGVTALIIVAVVVFFSCVLTYMAAAGKLRDATAELRVKQKRVDESKEIAQKLEKSKLDYFDARAQVRNLECSVSSQDYVPTLLKQIEHLGKSVNLRVLGVRPQPADTTVTTRTLSSGSEAAQGDVEGASEEKTNAKGGQTAKSSPPPYDELKIELQVEGKYMDALAFLYKLTSFPKIVAVNTMEMAPQQQCPGSTGSPYLSIKMNVTAFILKNEQPDIDPEAPADSAAGGNSTLEGRTRNEAG